MSDGGTNATLTFGARHGYAGINTGGIGRYSWGVLESKDTRANGIGIAVTGNILSSGISTFPTIQRRGYGIRSNGALRKDLG